MLRNAYTLTCEMVLTARHTSVRKGTKFAFCPVFLFGYGYLGGGGTDRREILHNGTRVSRMCLLPFWGRCLQGIPQIPHLPDPV